MVSSTHKTQKLRRAIATAAVPAARPQTADAIEQRKLHKGDIFEFAGAAGLTGIRKKPAM